MTKKIIIFIITVLILFFLVFYIRYHGDKTNINRGNKIDLEMIGKDEPVAPKTIQKLDTTGWTPAQIHLDVQIVLPATWHETTDGIYNYDQTKVTGLRDPNFPDNSFKCVFLDAKGQDQFYEILKEEKISDNPQIKYLQIKWNENQEPTPARSPGEETQIYLVDSPTRSGIQIECVIFKGELTQSDRNILENVLYSIR
ncbi:hypothetical protein A2V49_04700 [candidate division WWE3 bacterium RBG_19FT_COMBO_34_6]|uniref:Uncharacterized protein n=1 Tax=candidate division WWE3 bacterium RBG_19FT_COMBO_34_6 TaxID=1802612 RepID=A0A1F4UJT2_UNCKA|nr:MAG: hypothetical protein A2V49_04700 [candidate division WWE3 bacterium RBG_19FT_COMBO_34_6]